MTTVEIHGLPTASPLRTRVTKQVTKVLTPLHAEPVSARVTFFDDNGPKGGKAIRCAVMVRIPHRPDVRVEHTAATPRQAFGESIAALERQLAKYRERQAERRRRPKKYYIAKRLLSEGLDPSGAGR